MKGIYLIAIAFLASWNVITASKLSIIFEAENECPAEDTCPPKLIRHETDCAKYYECKYSSRQLRSCAAGLFFSKIWRGCVRQEISDCPFVPDPTTTTTTTTQRSVGDCVHGELLPHECKCIKFYECINGRKALRECKAGEHFNKYSRTCELGTDCNDPTPIPPVCEEGKNSPHECQCNKYYFCKGGRKALRECDKGMHFDKTSLVCVAGEGCDPLPPPRCVNGNMKKHDCHCDKYYICNSEEWIVQSCPTGEHFSENQKKCTDPITAGCDKSIIPKPGECPSSSPSKFAHECDCRLYYQCESGMKKIYDCSWGNYFDKANLKCDTAANVKGSCKNTWDTWV